MLVKHALPVLDAAVPAREWPLSPAGEAASAELAERLRPFLPFTLVTSPEPKARRTGEIAGAALGVPIRVVDGLREIDRRALPILSTEAHHRMIAPIFTDPDRPVLGEESATDALARFDRAVRFALAEAAGRVVAVTHGTVMALFIAAHNGLDAWDLWQRLDCGDFLVLEPPSFRLVGPARR